MTQIPDDLLEQLDGVADEGGDELPAAAAQEIRSLRAAVNELWLGTVWGAGKGAVFEGHKSVLLRAGVSNIGD